MKARFFTYAQCFLAIALLAFTTVGHAAALCDGEDSDFPVEAGDNPLHKHLKKMFPCSTGDSSPPFSAAGYSTVDAFIGFLNSSSEEQVSDWINARDSNGWTPLFLALRGDFSHYSYPYDSPYTDDEWTWFEKHIGLITLHALLYFGADPNLCTDDNAEWCPLHSAASKYPQREGAVSVEMLLDACADPNAIHRGKRWGKTGLFKPIDVARDTAWIQPAETTIKLLENASDHEDCEPALKPGQYYFKQFMSLMEDDIGQSADVDAVSEPSRDSGDSSAPSSTKSATNNPQCPGAPIVAWSSGETLVDCACQKEGLIYSLVNENPGRGKVLVPCGNR